jgi:hypothetical protein
MKRIEMMEFNKLIFLIGIFLIIAACVPSKKKNGNNYFEGEIRYKNEYIAKTGEADTAALVRELGAGTNYYFKEGNHFERYSNASALTYKIYSKKTNKLYYIKENQGDTMHWIDCSDNVGGRMLKFELHLKAEKILGIECDELITYYDNRTVFDYFNSDKLRINPDWLSKFKVYDKGWVFQKMGALPLKHKIEYKTFIYSSTATAIKEQTINDSLFMIPKSKVLIVENWL